MGHQEIAQLLGNYGEFFGSIVLIATLIYLSVQIRQHTKQMTSAYSLALWERTQDRFMAIASSPELSVVIAKAKDPEAILTAGESEQISAYISSWFGDLEEVYRQHLLGAVGDYALQSRVQHFSDVVLKLSGAESAMTYWRVTIDKQFMTWLDEQLKEIQSLDAQG
jgi:hypothetical protein